MGKLLALVALLVAIGVAYIFNKNYYFPPKLPPPEDGYFGAGAKKQDNTKIVPFTIHVDNATLEDLRGRLDNARFYEPLESVNFEYGFNTEFLKKVRDHWQNAYDWKKAEAELNKYTHFKTEIEGVKVHFVEIKPPGGKYKKVYPLLLVHGWPGSVYEFWKIIPMLTDPKQSLGIDSDFAFHVIAPSIPGYAWSDAPKKPGFSPIVAGRVFKKLMNRLKFDRYFCQGGDWGSIITTTLSQTYPEQVIGLHLNMAFVASHIYPGIIAQMLLGTVLPNLVVHPQDYYKVYPLSNVFGELLQESGYMHIQATKPDTVGFSLNDSPLGLAAYIIEKFSTWTKKEYRNLADGGLSKHWTMDELLTNIMIYWTTGSIASSQRFYKEFFGKMGHPQNNAYEAAPVLVPTGIAAFPNELVPTQPRNFLTYKFRNITQYTDMPRGGHFAAFEEPKLLAEDIFKFVDKVPGRN